METHEPWLGGKKLGRLVKGMGGAMDLVASAENIVVAMMHTNKRGESKLLKRCRLPLTGVNCVKKIVTNLAVIEVTNQGFKLLERAPDIIMAFDECTPYPCDYNYAKRSMHMTHSRN